MSIKSHSSDWKVSFWTFAYSRITPVVPLVHVVWPSFLHAAATDATARWRGTREHCTTVTKSSWSESWATWPPTAPPCRTTSTASTTSARAPTPTAPSREASPSCSLGNRLARVHTHKHTHACTQTRNEVSPVQTCVSLCAQRLPLPREQVHRGGDWRTSHHRVQRAVRRRPGSS